MRCLPLFERRAYPRWRGGNSAGCRSIFSFRGLSPLARGKRRWVAARELAMGPIPAGAGETPAERKPQPHERAYPRWRGGNLAKAAEFVGGKGLSPLARGKHRGILRKEGQEGPIPAGAGETRRPSRALRGTRAYPRWRGGNRIAPPWGGFRRGLSPLARGKRFLALPLKSGWGPIPAGAGETHAVSNRGLQVWAYPRWRGGNTVTSYWPAVRSGLSPLARGKLLAPV